MGKFIDTLRGKDDEWYDEPRFGGAAPTPSPGALQLPLDVYQADREILIYAQLPGTDIGGLDVSITGKNDVVTIIGHMRRPEEWAPAFDPDGEFTLLECRWGEFYRQVVLPEEIDPEESEAKTKDGVLIIRLPVKGPGRNGIKIQVLRMPE